MFLQWQNWNLKSRLTAMLTVTVSIGLALVFMVVVFLVREQALNRRFSEIEKDVKRISGEWSTPNAFPELQEDYPGLEVTVFKPNGEILASTTKRPPLNIVGRQKSGDTLTFGYRHADSNFVGVASWVETEAGLHQLAFVLAILWLPLTAVTAAVAWHVGGLIMRPVSELVASAEKLSGTAEGEILHTTDGAEFAALAHSLNQLIARVRRVGSLQEQFASDAAHELRTPLAMLQTRIEVNLQNERTSQEHVNAQRAMLRQIDRLASIVGALLRTARQNGETPQIEDFSNAVRVAASEWVELTQWPKSAIQIEIEECSSTISQDEISIILRNLLDNAASHSPEGSSIQLRVTCSGDMITLTVGDCGPGLKAEAMTRAFERFYRTEEARGRQNGGAGIGLAVVKRIVESHAGSVEFMAVENGALVRLILPSATS